MPRLITDKEKCVDCGKCEEILPTFKHIHKGELYISYAKMRDSISARRAVELVIKECKGKAIKLEQA